VHTIALSRRRRSDLYEGGFDPDRDYWFFDILINGESMVDAFRTRGRDLVSCLGWGPEDWRREKALRLLGQAPADFPNDRRSILVCSECGDLGCGAISARIRFDADSVTWEAFGYENTYDDEGPYLEDYRDVGLWTFERSAYEAVISSGI
jgi:hypothetical protein